MTIMIKYTTKPTFVSFFIAVFVILYFFLTEEHLTTKKRFKQYEKCM